MLFPSVLTHTHTRAPRVGNKRCRFVEHLRRRWSADGSTEIDSTHRYACNVHANRIVRWSSVSEIDVRDYGRSIARGFVSDVVVKFESRKKIRRVRALGFDAIVKLNDPTKLDCNAPKWIAKAVHVIYRCVSRSAFRDAERFIAIQSAIYDAKPTVSYIDGRVCVRCPAESDMMPYTTAKRPMFPVGRSWLRGGGDGKIIFSIRYSRHNGAIKLCNPPVCRRHSFLGWKHANVTYETGHVIDACR